MVSAVITRVSQATVLPRPAPGSLAALVAATMPLAAIAVFTPFLHPAIAVTAIVLIPLALLRGMSRSAARQNARAAGCLSDTLRFFS